MRKLTFITIALNGLTLLCTLWYIVGSAGNSLSMVFVPFALAGLCNIAVALRARPPRGKFITLLRGLSYVLNILLVLINVLMVIGMDKTRMVTPVSEALAAFFLSTAAISLLHLAKTRNIEGGGTAAAMDAPPAKKTESRLQRDYRKTRRYRLLVMQIGIAQGFGIGLHIRDVLEDNGDAAQILYSCIGFFGFAGILAIAWWELGKRLECLKLACRFSALGVEDEEARALVKAEGGNVAEAQRLREKWDARYLQNRAAVDGIDREFRRIMMEKYHVRPDWIDAGPKPGTQPLAKFATLIQAGPKTAAEAADGLYQALADDSEQGNPRIFSADEKGAELPQGNPALGALNKALFGSHAPSPHARAMTLVLLAGLAGSVYGYNGSLFIPAPEWGNFGMGLSLSLAAASTAWLVYGHLTGKIKVKSNMRPAARAVCAVLMSPLIFLMYWGTLAEGIGAAITETTGQAGTQAYTVHKFISHSKYGTHYCLLNDTFKKAIVFYNFCALSEGHYNILPDVGDVVFRTHQSALGLTLESLENPAPCATGADCAKK